MDAQKEDGDVQASRTGSPANADSLHSKSDAQNGEVNDTNATEGAAPSKATSKASSTRNSTPAASASENQPAPDGSTDATAAMDVDQQNQESKNNDSDSAQPSRNDSEEAAAAPYGTRSRNRPGRSRINYAEDTEMDFEMTAPAPTNGNVSDPSSRSSVAAESGQPPVAGGKKGAGAGPSSAPWGNSGPNAKDTQANLSISGSSATTPAAQTTIAQTTTKRRKTAAKDATNGVQAGATAPSQTTKRGAQAQVQAPATAAAPYTRESNMMTFEFSGGMLKDGRLQADDGQTVSVNGKF
jgi:hypothetical protein